jgi:hypothetical protein
MFDDPSHRFRILERTGDELVAIEVKSMRQAPEKPQAGVYDTALRLLRRLRNPDVLDWVTPPRRAAVPQFDPAAFGTSTVTLYLLSMEDWGAASPLVATLTEHVWHAAATRPLGRLDPMVTCILDEAASLGEYTRLCRRSVLLGAGCHAGLSRWGRPNSVRSASWSSTSTKVRRFAGGTEVRNPASISRMSLRQEVSTARPSSVTMFIAAVPVFKALTNTALPRIVRAAGELLEGAAKPVGSDAEVVVQLEDQRQAGSHPGG